MAGAPSRAYGYDPIGLTVGAHQGGGASLLLRIDGLKDIAPLVKLRREASEENYMDFIRSEFGYERRPLEELESK